MKTVNIEVDKLEILSDINTWGERLRKIRNEIISEIMFRIVEFSVFNGYVCPILRARVSRNRPFHDSSALKK